MANLHDITSKILVVDDEKLIRLTISAKLKAAGYVSIAVDTVEKAVAVLKEPHVELRAIITDIMMGDMDGFVFRDIIRGHDPTIPIFFMTALDPEEGSGFLKKILDDANSYYLPKAVKPAVMINRIKSVVASRRVEQFIARQIEEQRMSMTLAANVQHSMLPTRVVMTGKSFYTTLWKPKEMVSGDLYESLPLGDDVNLYVLGDIQGHGTSAALAMTAMQAFLKQFARREGQVTIAPNDVANMLQQFFRRHLADVTYMTALICIHRLPANEVEWMSCGAPDLVIVDPKDPGKKDINPDKRGGLPIGLMPDTVYSHSDVIHTKLADTAVCVAYSDGLFDISRDAKHLQPIPENMIHDIGEELISSARLDGSIIAVPQKYMTALEECGYRYSADDITLLLFGKRLKLDGIYEHTVPLTPDDISNEAVRVGAWCQENGWDDDLINRVQLVIEEALMNVHDHGVDTRERLNAVASLRLRHIRDFIELTIWDCGTPPPSVEIAAGDSGVAFELKNREFSGRGRGRLIMRELCNGISRSRYENLNETIYFIPEKFEAESNAK